MKLKKYVILLIMLIIVFSGCSQNCSTSKYLNSAKEFNKLYFEIVENVDSGNHKKSFEKLQRESDKGKIERLGVLLEDIKKSIPQNREILLENFKQRYEDLVFLVESYPRLNNLSFDDRGKIDRIFILTELNKENRKDKKSSIVWQ